MESVAKCCVAVNMGFGPVTIMYIPVYLGMGLDPLLSLFGKQRCLGFTVSFFVPFIFQATNKEGFEEQTDGKEALQE